MNITVIIAVAILIEALVEYAKTIMKMVEGGENKTAITQCATVALGILLAFAFNADLFIPIGIEVNHSVGTIITGIIASRGSNYVSDFIGKLGQKTVG